MKFLQKLIQYLKENNISVAQFAVLIKASRHTVYSWLEGKKVPPKPDNVIAVYILTKGGIEPNDWYELPDLSDADKPEATTQVK